MPASVERIRPYPRPRERLPVLAGGGRVPIESATSTMKEAA